MCKFSFPKLMRDITIKLTFRTTRLWPKVNTDSPQDNTNFVNSLNNHYTPTPTFFDWSRAHYAMISEDLCSVDWNHVFQHCFHVEDCWSMFTETLTRSVNEHVPVVHTSTKRNKYPTRHYPRYIRKLINDKGIAWKRWKFSKLECDKLAYKAAAAQCSSAIFAKTI